MSKIRLMNNLKQMPKIRMPAWQVLWRTTGVLLIALGIVGLVAFGTWFGQYKYVEDQAKHIPELILLVSSCLVAIVSGLIIVVWRFWRDYPRVIILYTLALIAGFTGIGLGCNAGNDSGLETAVSALGISTVILTCAIIMMRNHQITGRKARHAKIPAVSVALFFLLFVLGGFVLPQWFDAAARAFPDTRLRAVIREEVGKAFGWIQLSDLEGITYLDAHYRNINNITGLEKCTEIAELWIFGNYELSDITPLSSLSKLDKISLFWCDVSDVAPLANLTNLQYLDLYGNTICDISHLSNLRKLSHLDLDNNNIEDISIIVNLFSLNELKLARNRIADISPLLKNEGLGEGDVVSLGGNPLNEASIDIYIPQLEQRGVVVYR